MAIEIDFCVLKEGGTPPRVVFERVLPFPEKGANDIVVLRNIGGQTADLRGWWMVDALEGSRPFVFGEKLMCDEYEFIPPAGRLTMSVLSRHNRCGFLFNLSVRDTLYLYNADDELVDVLMWGSSERGQALRRQPNGFFQWFSERRNVLETLRDMGTYTIFLEALKVTGLDQTLSATARRYYSGPHLPKATKIPLFPSYFGFARKREAPRTPPPPQHPQPGVPTRGPFTILAPDDDAMLSAIRQIGGEHEFGVEEFLGLPELKDIIMYHIIPGRWTSDFFQTGRPIFTARASEVVPLMEGRMAEGKVFLSDRCVDKPTPGKYTCRQQKDFNKCGERFMKDALGAGWVGGFCERTCGRCECDSDSCAEVVQLDIVSSNGIVHSLNRLLFPPPVFSESHKMPVNIELKKRGLRSVPNLLQKEMGKARTRGTKKL
ncbi:hypothetical protein BSKO_00848 [Bryopsis sp. KO-2023]|nr:hypothetical protein BSKO_00848 [Bryopsis sp. KO-2023]